MRIGAARSLVMSWLTASWVSARGVVWETLLRVGLFARAVWWKGKARFWSKEANKMQKQECRLLLVEVRTLPQQHIEVAHQSALIR